MYTVVLNNIFGQAINIPAGTSAVVTDLAGNSVAGTLAALATPAAPTLTPSTTGGTLPASTTNNYRIVAVNKYGNTVAGPEAANATTTGSTSSIAISWTAVPGATSYQVYGRTAGSEQLLATVSGTTYTDTGAATPSGALPGSNTSGRTALTSTLSGGIAQIVIPTIQADNVTAVTCFTDYKVSFPSLAGYTNTFTFFLNGNGFAVCNIESDAEVTAGLL